MRLRDAGLRIDHFLLSPPLAVRLSDAGVDRDVRARARPAITRRRGSFLQTRVICSLHNPTAADGKAGQWTTPRDAGLWVAFA